MMTKNGFSLVASLGVGLLVATCGMGCGSPPSPAMPDMAGGGEASKDSDGDGIPDKMDKCPDQKEDGVAPEPKDGCPSAAPATPAAPAKPKP